MTRWTLPEESPRASPERIQRFLGAYSSTALRHGEEFLPLMSRNDAEESRITAHDAQLNDGLRSIYRVRAKTTAMAPRSPLHPPGLADDVRDLVVQLDAAQDQPLCFWTILIPSGVCYIVFELMHDNRIAGCVKSADQRIVNPTPR